MEFKHQDVFCRIVHGELPTAKIWEDRDYMAILDINPNVRGQAVLFPKRHAHSYPFDFGTKQYMDMMLATKKVARLLERGLKVKRVAMVMEGMGVNHAHVKLYPLHGLKNKFGEVWSDGRVSFNKYEGYVSTQLGPQAEMGKLKRLAASIRKG